METYSFIGSDKNAGKTTALNFVYRLLYKKGSKRHLFLTSIGINGEPIDSYEQHAKPITTVFRDSFFVTAGEHLNGLAGRYRVRHVFDSPEFSKPYVLARASSDLSLVMEGPNDKAGMQKIKAVMQRVGENGLCLIDGSVDRQFLGHPSISDAICFALLLSSRPEQQEKACGLLTALSLRRCSPEVAETIGLHLKPGVKSIFIGAPGDPVAVSYDIPFLDDRLKQNCLKNRGRPGILYINGALSKSLADFLSPLENLTLVLNDFTCYQRVTTSDQTQMVFKPELVLYHAVPLKILFIKQECEQTRIDIPLHSPAFNLFRDNCHDLGI